MAYLYQHLKTSDWAYFSPFPKVSPNTFVTNSERLLYIGGPGEKAKYKIKGVPIGTRVTVDMEEHTEDYGGYHRPFKFPDIATLVPPAVTAFLKEKFPGAPEEWQIWMDESGLSVWEDPVEPDPIDPPVPTGRTWRYVITVEEVKG